jgi:uncharacterized membrane protein YeaQ/YmgE (transglycosylase-associated protein family)
MATRWHGLLAAVIAVAVLSLVPTGCHREHSVRGGAPRRAATMSHLIWSVLTGFVIGLLARAVMPGADHMGLIATSLLGIGGSFVGGLIGRLISPPQEGAVFHPAGFFLSIVGAIVLLYAFRLMQ